MHDDVNGRPLRPARCGGHPAPDRSTLEAPATEAGAAHPTLAQVQIELAASLARACARPPRWPLPREASAPELCAFFLISAASVAWVDAAAAHPAVAAVDVSIEAMGAFAAIEASVATGRLQIVICGSGPGAVGPLWALPAARGQGASVLVLVPRTPAHLVDGTDIQEVSHRQPLHALGAGIYDDVIPMEDMAEMPRVALRLRRLFARPQGAVVQLSVPTNLLFRPCDVQLPDLRRVQISPPAPSARALRQVAAELRAPGGPPAFLLGSGAVPYRDRLRALVTRWGGVHFSTPAAAAILPGSIGVIGNAAHGDVPRRLAELGVRVVVVVGSRLGTGSGGGERDLLPPGCSVVVVDVDPAAINALALRDRRVLAVTSDIGCFLDGLDQLPEPAGELTAVGGAGS
jgi:thiamine pyrophosphate-dependent acetolactate synthase large subunit-like protein